jgi:hypothetical protein
LLFFVFNSLFVFIFVLVLVYLRGVQFPQYAKDFADYSLY